MSDPGGSFAYHTGQTVGKYKLESLIGRGGMAEVYRSRHPELDRDLAIKILHPHHTDEAGFVERFRREARAVAALRHPHIVQIYDFAVILDGLFYMVMEFIDGGSLEERLRRQNGPLPLAEAASAAPANGTGTPNANGTQTGRTPSPPLTPTPQRTPTPSRTPSLPATPTQAPTTAPPDEPTRPPDDVPTSTPTPVPTEPILPTITVLPTVDFTPTVPSIPTVPLFG